MKKILMALAFCAVLPAAFVAAQSKDIAANEKVEKVEAITSVANTKGTKLYVVGDSTLSSFNDPYFYPRYGYGTKLQDFLDAKKIEVINLAMSGRSSLSFLTEANYQTLKNNIKKGDYLLIGFGHNDEKAEQSRYTDANGSKETKGSFKNVLYENYIKLALDKKATPILATPIVRRAPGKTYEGAFVHITKDQEGFPGGDYPKAIRDLGKECGIAVVDNTAMTKALYEKSGDDGTIKFHAWLSNKPATVDNTHLNTYGASKVAYMVVTSIAAQDKKFAKLVKKDIAEPTEALLVKNPAYVIPTYAPFDPAADASANFKTTAPWYGTVFGDMGGPEKIANPDVYEIVEDGGKVTMHSGAKDGSVSAGKIASASDGLAFYFQQVPAGKDFVMKATAKLLNAGKNNQVSYGIMARDDVYIDKFDNSIHSNYVACGPIGLASDVFTTSFSRIDGTLDKTHTAAVEKMPAKDTVVNLTISRKGDEYTVQYGKEAPVTYKMAMNDIDKDFDYVGLYTVRSAWVEFSNVSLEVK